MAEQQRKIQNLTCWSDSWSKFERETFRAGSCSFIAIWRGKEI